MNVYIYVCMYVCMVVCMHGCMYVYIYMFVVRMRMGVWVNECTYLSEHLWW